MENTVRLIGLQPQLMGRDAYSGIRTLQSEVSTPDSHTTSKRLIVAVAVSMGILLFSIAYYVYSTKIQPARSAFASTATAAGAIQVAPSAKMNSTSNVYTPILEVHIAHNGLSLIRGARVTQVLNNAVIAMSDWGDFHSEWNVYVNSDTKFFNRDGTPGSTTAINVGDYISITGDLRGTVSKPQIIAQFIHKEN